MNQFTSNLPSTPDPDPFPLMTEHTYLSALLVTNWPPAQAGRLITALEDATLLGAPLPLQPPERLVLGEALRRVQKRLKQGARFEGPPDLLDALEPARVRAALAELEHPGIQA